MPKSNIGIVLGVSGDKEFKAALTASKKEVSNLQNDLKLLSKEFEGNANSQEALRAKLEKLTQIQSAYAKRVEEAKSGLENAKKNYEDSSKALEDLQDKLKEATEKQKELEEAGDTSSQAYKDLEKEIEELNSAISKQAIDVSKAAGSQSDWQKELNNSEAALKNCSSEIEKTEGYLKEAEEASDGLAKSIDEMGKEAEEAAEGTQKLSISLGDMVKAKAVDLMGDAIKQLAQKAVEAAKYIIEVGSAFEAQMSKVKAISGASSAEMEKLTAKASEMGRTTKFTATEAGEALEYMAMAGWKTDEMLDGLEGVMYLAAASGEDLGTTSDIVTDALTALGLQASDSAHFADILAVASSNANTNVGMMGETFKYVAPVAGSLGYAAEDLAEQIGIAANAGIKASQAGTGLRAIITRLATDAGASSTSLGALGVLTQQLGVEFYDAQGKARGLNEVISEAREAWRGLTDEEQQNYAKKIAGQNAITMWNALMNASAEDVAKLEDALENCDGAAENMAEVMQDNLQGRLTLFHSAVEGLGVALYDYFDGPLKGVVEIATDLINHITDALTPQKTLLDEFIADIKEANKELGNELDKINDGINDVTLDNMSLDSYYESIDKVINALGDVKDAKDNTFTISDSYQIYEIDAALRNLEEVLPGVSAGWDKNTGTLKLNTEELRKNIKEYQTFSQGKALLSALKSREDTLAQAAAEVARAQSAFDKANEGWRYTEKLDSEVQLNAAKENADKARESYEDFERQIDELASSVGMSRSEFESWIEKQEEARAATEEEGGTIEDLNAILEEEGEAMDAASDSVGDHQKAIEDLADAYGVTVDEVTELSKKFGSNDEFDQWAASMVSTMEKLRDASEENLKTLRDNFDGVLSGFSKFPEAAELTMDQFITNLSESITGVYQWKTDMFTLADEIGQGFSQELFDELYELGPGEMNGLVHEMAEAARNGYTEKLDEMSGLTAEKLGIISDDDLAACTTAGKAIATAQADGYLEESAGLPAAVSESVQQVAVAVQEGAQETAVVMHEVGSRSADEFQIGIWEKQDLARQAGRDVANAAGQGAAEAATDTNAAGQQMAESTASGITQASGEVQTAAADMVESGRASAEQIASDFYVAGQIVPQRFRQGINDAKQWAVQAAEAIGNESLAAITQKYNQFHDTGYNLAMGLANGINSGSSAAIQAAVNMAVNALNAANKALEVSSPSKKFIKTGEYSGEGLAIGFENSGDMVLKSVRDVIDEMSSMLEEGLDFKNKQAPVYGVEIPDLTALSDAYANNAARMDETSSTTQSGSAQPRMDTTRLEAILSAILQAIPRSIILDDGTIAGRVDNILAQNYYHDNREAVF